MPSVSQVSNTCPRCRKVKPGYRQGVRTCLSCKLYKDAFMKTDVGRRSYNRSKTKWRASEHGRELRLAHAYVSTALRRGKLVKEPCEVCQNVDTQAHHDSYAKEDRLNVRWLCIEHHREAHNVTVG